MNWPELRRAFRLPLGKRAVEVDVAAELDFHIQGRIEELMAAGMSRAEAEREARARFGNRSAIGAQLEQIDRRMVRRRTARESLEALMRDLRFAVRALRKSPGFTLVAVLTLSLAIGANTAIFSAVDGVLLRPLSVPGLDRLFVIQQNAPQLKLFRGQLSPPEIEDLARHGELFEAVAGSAGTSYNLTGSGDPSRVTAVRTMGRFFELFSVRPALGRLYGPEQSESGNELVAVLTDGFWRDWAGADSSVIGRGIELNSRVYQVIGVLPADFTYRRTAQVYVPIALTPEVRAGRGRWSTTALARLQPGLTPVQLTAGLDRIETEWRGGAPPSNSIDGQRYLSAESLVAVRAGELQPVLKLLMVAVLLVLLIACVNVAHLQIVRAAAREKELAVRAAMGSGRWPLVRQLLVESTLIAVAGGALGLVLGTLAIRVLTRMTTTALPILSTLRLDRPVLLFAVAVTFVSALVFGVFPALRAARTDLHGVLRETARGSSAGGRRSRLLRLSVAAQVALSLILLLGAGLLIRSLARLLDTDPGFQPSQVITFQVTLPGATYPKAPERVAFFDQLSPRLAAIPGVETVGAVSDLPFAPGRNSSPFSIAGRPEISSEPARHADMRFVQADYFRAMGIPLTRGRSFAPADRLGSPWVSVIDESLARQYFEGQDPIGQTISQGGPTSVIIGVVGAIKHGDLSEPDKPTIYYAYTQAPWYSGLYLTLRTAQDPGAIMVHARGAVAELDPKLPVHDVRLMQERVDDSLGARRLVMMVLSAFALLALLLALLGVYGVLSYIISRRTHELGIRLALGAVPRDVVRMVLGSGLALTGVGLAIGLAGFLLLARMLSSLLYGVSPRDPLTIAVGTGVLALGAAAAALVPALRASRVDPMDTLKEVP